MNHDEDEFEDEFEVGQRLYKEITEGPHAGKYVCWDPTSGTYVVLSPEFTPPLVEWQPDSVAGSMHSRS